MVKIKQQVFFSLIFVILFLTACGNNNTVAPVSTEEVVTATASGYPTPSSGYPLPEVNLPGDAYPSQDSVTNSSATLLAFDKPIQSTDSVITGVGPSGLTVYILNMTFMGTELGSGVIDNDGKFAITVSELQPGTRIGLTADLTTLGLTENDIRPGDGEMAVPRVGYFFDTVVLPQQ